MTIALNVSDNVLYPTPSVKKVAHNMRTQPAKITLMRISRCSLVQSLSMSSTAKPLNMLSILFKITRSSDMFNDIELLQ